MSKDRKVGLITATSLVVGNMIGAGIYVLPAALANFGSVSLLGWVITATGALILAKIFSNFSKIIVNKSGGPYIYSREGFGDFIGYLVAWGYWISIWISNAAIAIALVSALSYFLPSLASNPIMAVGTGLGFIWLLTWINSKGIRESGRLQVITTVIKILPLVFISVLGIFFFRLENFPAFNLTDSGNLVSFSAVTTLTLYAFVGVECATIPAENIENPHKNVPRATMLGTIITTIIYILGTVVLFGIIPAETLNDSPAPFAQAARLIGGGFFGSFVAAGAAVSALGALNGWILISAQIPMAAARDNLFPKIFKKENENGIPIFGLLIGSVLSSLVMLMNFSSGLVDQFQFMVNLTVLACLVPYAFVSASYMLVVAEKRLHLKSSIKTWVLGGLGFAYSVWAIFGSGSETVFYGFLLLLMGIPFYVVLKRKGQDIDEDQTVAEIEK